MYFNLATIRIDRQGFSVRDKLELWKNVKSNAIGKLRAQCESLLVIIQCNVVRFTGKLATIMRNREGTVATKL